MRVCRFLLVRSCHFWFCRSCVNKKDKKEKKKKRRKEGKPKTKENQKREQRRKENKRKSTNSLLPHCTRRARWSRRDTRACPLSRRNVASIFPALRPWPAGRGPAAPTILFFFGRERGIFFHARCTCIVVVQFFRTRTNEFSFTNNNIIKCTFLLRGFHYIKSNEHTPTSRTSAKVGRAG